MKILSLGERIKAITSQSGKIGVFLSRKLTIQNHPIAFLSIGNSKAFLSSGMGFHATVGRKTVFPNEGVDIRIGDKNIPLNYFTISPDISTDDEIIIPLSTLSNDAKRDNLLLRFSLIEDIPTQRASTCTSLVSVQKYSSANKTYDTATKLVNLSRDLNNFIDRRKAMKTLLEMDSLPAWGVLLSNPWFCDLLFTGRHPDKLLRILALANDGLMPATNFINTCVPYFSQEALTRIHGANLLVLFVRAMDDSALSILARRDNIPFNKVTTGTPSPLDIVFAGIARRMESTPAIKSIAVERLKELKKIAINNLAWAGCLRDILTKLDGSSLVAISRTNDPEFMFDLKDTNHPADILVECQLEDLRKNATEEVSIYFKEKLTKEKWSYAYLGHLASFQILDQILTTLNLTERELVRLLENTYRSLDFLTDSRMKVKTKEKKDIPLIQKTLAVIVKHTIAQAESGNDSAKQRLYYIYVNAEEIKRDNKGRAIFKHPIKNFLIRETLWEKIEQLKQKPYSSA